MKDKFWIAVGDIHDDPGQFSRIPGLAHADGIIITGDLTMLGGVQKAQEVLAQMQPGATPVLGQIGNMDLPEVNEWLDSRDMNLHDKVRELAPGVAIFGVGGSTVTPFDTPSEFSEEAYKNWLNEMWPAAAKYPHTILISHNPPKDTICDDLGNGAHVGSESVRQFIEEHQPDLCICGHIHEAKGTDHIGQTLIINPGQLNQGGYVVVKYENGKLTAELREVTD